MQNTVFKSFFVFICLIFIFGCSRIDPGSELIGKWTDISSPKYNVVIEQNGDGFIVRKTQMNFMYGGVETINLPATLKDGVLYPSQFLSTPLSLDHATGNLTDGRAEYRREK